MDELTQAVLEFYGGTPDILCSVCHITQLIFFPPNWYFQVLLFDFIRCAFFMLLESMPGGNMDTLIFQASRVF